MKSGKQLIDVFAWFKGHEGDHVIFNRHTDTVMVYFYPVVNPFCGAFQFSQSGNILYAFRFFNVLNGLFDFFFQRNVFDFFNIVQKRRLKTGVHGCNAFITSSRLTLGVCSPFSISDTKCASASSSESIVCAEAPIRLAKAIKKRTSDFLRGWIITASIHQFLLNRKNTKNNEQRTTDNFHTCRCGLAVRAIPRTGYKPARAGNVYQPSLRACEAIQTP
jgi:hypothetical protein